MIKRKAKIKLNECVACGCCVKSCPKAAITISYGIQATVNTEKCVGCSLCAKKCPADVIEMVSMEVLV